jgi:hypothetical protein
MSLNDDFFKDQMAANRERLLRAEEKSIHAYEKAAFEKEFEKVNRRELANWPDEKLAAWQAKYPSESPQFLLAQFEWNRRLTADQIKAARWAAWIGLAGVIVGALLTRILEKI